MALQRVKCARYCFLLLVVWIVSPFKFILLSSDLVLFEFDKFVHFFGFRISGIVFILFEVVGKAGGHRRGFLKSSKRVDLPLQIEVALVFLVRERRHARFVL